MTALPAGLNGHAFERSGCQLIIDEPVIAARERGSAAECLEDALSLLRTGADLPVARSLLNRALEYLDSRDQRLSDEGISDQFLYSVRTRPR